MPIPITNGGESAGEVRIEAIRLPTVHGPDQYRAELSVTGPTAALDRGDSIRIGPFPPTDLRIEGIVVEKAPADEVVVIDVEAMRHRRSTQPRMQRRNSPREIGIIVAPA